uniref:Palmitoyltransferase PFA3 ) n=1 Tax=Ganoderma boninense TaxID=34458 RepID=A0A5K1JUF3_9APHY|nr:Palmitoyltransferase PFA3 (EC (Protein fatty acyltransferase 3) [Ganoderma boninense]
MERSQASWPFVSARLQEHPDRQHDLADDLESFMHVLNYCALKHLPDAASTEAESAYLTQCLYDAIVPTDSPHHYLKGSPLKLEKVQTGTPFVQGLPAQHPLASLLAELSQLCKQHYEHVVLPESPPRSPSPDSIFARGSCSGAEGPLPDFDGDSDLLDGSDDTRDGRPTRPRPRAAIPEHRAVAVPEPRPHGWRVHEGDPEGLARGR